MSSFAIRAELETRLKTWADAQTPKVPIAFENVGFSKPSDGSLWLEAFLIPNTTMNFELAGNRKTELGLFQINCWAPKGNGMRDVETLAQSIVSLYPLLPKTGSVSIENTPSVSKPIEDDPAWVIVPVLVSYRHEAT